MWESEAETRENYPDLFTIADFEGEVWLKWGRVVTPRLHIFILTLELCLIYKFSP